MINVKQQVQEWINNTKDIVSKSEVALTGILEPIKRQFEMGMNVSVANDFGKALHSCLGEKIRGLAESVINMKALTQGNHKYIAENAAAKKMTIEDYLVKEDFTTGWNGVKHFRKSQVFITTGRRFGFSYISGDQGRKHTTYIEDGGVFQYMMQEHVDLIPNKEKRNCAQEFLNFRNEYVEKLNELCSSENSIVKVSIPVTVASVVRMTIDDVYDYNSQRQYGTIIQGTSQDVINYVTITIPEMPMWNGYSPVKSYNVNGQEYDPYIQIDFGNVSDNPFNNKVKNTTCYGTMSISKKKIFTQYSDIDDRGSDGSVFNKVINGTHAQEVRMRDIILPCNGVVLNMDDIVKNPMVMQVINKRLNFFTEYGEKLQELKHKHAGLYFLNE